MKIFSKKSKEMSCGGTERRTHDLWRWRKIGTVALCAALVFTTIGGGLITASAIGDLPAAAENESISAAEAAAGSEAAESEAAEQGPADTETAASETPDTEPAESTPTKDESTKPETTEPSGTESDEKDAVYTLHLTHYLRFTVDGESRHVQADQTIKLTEADFKDGQCDLNRFAYDAEQLMVTEANPVSLDAFDKDRQAGARIVYAVNSGWKLVPAEESIKGVALRNVFQGTNVDDYEFEPAKVVTFTVDYQYSKTGGLYGVSPYAPETIQALAEKENGEYVFEFPIKSKTGFRIVLDPTPLDKYLKKQPPANATPEELQQMLDDGDFNGDVTAHRIYAYQQEADNNNAEPNYAITNSTYRNIYSDEYNGAWNSARKLTVSDVAAGYDAQAFCGDDTHTGHVIGDHGANELKNPKIKVTMTEEQLENALENGRTITVNYRRTATWYTAKHWVPEGLSGLTEEEIGELDGTEKKNLAGTEYVLLDTETLQGRVGALTKAAAKTEGSIYERLTPLPFAQEIIKGIVSIGDLNQNSVKDETKPTEINIYYKAAASYRVIFDTDYAYIPRQQVNFNSYVDFSEGKVPTPTRKGYTFDGWQYLKKGAIAGDENAYVDVQKDSNEYSLKIDETLLNEAQLKTTDGVPALYLYPKWKADKTKITVVLWTEDLDGLTDVQAIAEDGNVKDDKSDYYSQKYKEYEEPVYPNLPTLNDPAKANTNYSNVGSFTMEVQTNSELKEEGTSKPIAEPISNIMDQVKVEFNKQKVETDTTDPIDFYDYAGFEVLHENNGTLEYETVANADGKTMVYVYFTRKIYTLKFHYYGSALGSDYAVATGTCGYSYAGKNCYTDDCLNFDYRDHPNKPEGSSNSKNYNTWYLADSVDAMSTPKIITISAKYGADLRNVWPVARANEIIESKSKETHFDTKMISWTATLGKYRDDSVTKENNRHFDEATIMGLFATMDEEIIAEPNNSEQVHDLVAYWENTYDFSTYRYNHCYEVPGLDINSGGIESINLYGNSNDELKNVIYLVPKTNESFDKYKFTDLLSVKYNEGTNTVEYSEYGKDNGGQYYAVRGYKTTDEEGNPVTKYYAVGRQIDTVSTNDIQSQNPSARAHMTKVNNVADHTTEHTDTDGRTWGSGKIGSTDNPYDLYFYYDRDRYTIHYKVAVNRSDSGETEKELGKIELPYGAHVTKEKYAFKLNYQDTNQQIEGEIPKYLWTYPEGEAVPVCPDRNENGTKEWKFKGWGLGPAGVNMQWTFNTSDQGEAQAQTTDDFYIGSNLLLYAIWENPMCTVTFHLNGGTAATYTTDQTIEVEVPANTKITETDANIPRPFYSGHTMEGWYVSKDDGTIENNADSFHFNAFITDDIHVAAKWNADTVKEYTYKVYYVTDNPKTDDVAKEKIYIKDGQIVNTSEGAEAYSVLGCEESSKSFVPGTTINLTAKEIEGYIPTETNQKLTFNNENSEYYVIFYYDSYTEGSYTVRYVEAGTETETDPSVIQQSVISEETVEADKAVLTPSEGDVETLKNKGYQLVNRNDDNTYTEVTKYDELKWIDNTGNLHGFSADMIDLLGESAEKTVTYLVQPIPYKITYQTADSSPTGAAAALDAVTAAESTVVNNAGQKNPTLYTVKDEFTLKNPSMVYVDGKAYEFSHWSLGTGTTETQAARLRGEGDESNSYNPLTVSQGTIGSLTFVAHWKAVTPQPPQEQTGSLTVSKTVTGNLGDKNQDFNFKVTLTGASVTGTFGGMTFENSVAEFILKHGETITATDLPAGISYKVEETGNEGYTVSAAGEEGTIQANGSSTASFTNHKSTGGTTPTYTTVTVKKVWKLDDGRKATDSVQVALLKNGAVEKTVTLSEANNWTYTWSGLALGNLWSVQELDVPEGFDSTVQQIGTALIITNDDNPVKPDDPDKPDKPTNPDKPDKPDKPTKPAKPVKPEDPDHSMVPDDGMIPGGASGSGMPQTGDVNNMSLYILLFTGSLAALAGIGVYLRGRKKNKK